MKSKVLVGILLFALMTVCIIAGGLGFMLWQQRQATAAAPVAQAAEPDPALLAAEPEVEPEAAEPVEEEPAPEPELRPAGPAFVYEYLPAHSKAMRAAEVFSRDLDVLRRLTEVNALEGVLMLPGPLRVLAAECDAINAYYVPERREVVLCYEMVNYLVELGMQLYTDEQGNRQRAVRDYLAMTRTMSSTLLE